MKKILITINTSWNIFNFRVGLLKALQKEGYKIVCVSPYDEYSKKLEDLGFEYHDIKMNNKGTNPIEDLKLIKDYYNLYKKINPDVILQYTIKPNIYGSIAARILGKKVISNISGLGTVFLNDNLSSKIARWLYKVALVKNSVFFQNNDDKDLFIENKLVQKEQCDLLPGSGINTDIYKPQEKSNELKENTNFTFMMIARLVKDKGILEYIEAIKIIKEKYPDVKFKLLGSLYEANPTAVKEEELNKWIENGLIDYLGHSDDVKSEIEKVDCVILPSYREGLSRVLLESASLAKPIITTDVPGCRDVVVHKENGFLCKVKNSEDLAQKIEMMILLSKEEIKDMGEKGRAKVVNEFDESIVIAKYLEKIKSLI
ncbi:glycosyltransferase family 4 protein [Poseidonibacter lekithochrous]|uniref:glycosyltransferase family 4 protein n=1 Tax=Poseidonibacter TaxID=2321187 RepID=UPI001C083E13|nr:MULTISPECIES: glycosyltransferase family 4 protein [Poseidonibacter]MBU3015743.1 glycosyltransferase family 4 protein [Poseidonibacter lekithochrous]MDO6829043.1 glycosyltransferase family 4 protein [Poseidonibacter sp. 1_MG-2023]